MAASPPETIAPAAPPGCSCGRCRAHAAGRFGPYTPAQFVEAFGVVNEPPPREIPAELSALATEVDAALDRYERASEAWTAAMATKGADEDRASTREVLEADAERLRAARAAYNAMARRLSDHRIAEEYAADQAAQTARREAELEARREAMRSPVRRQLARIRSKVAR